MHGRRRILRGGLQLVHIVLLHLAADGLYSRLQRSRVNDATDSLGGPDYDRLHLVVFVVVR